MEPLSIDIPDQELDDLRRRLGATRWPAQVEHAGWSRGTDASWLREIVDHWQHRYDWRRLEAELNGRSQFVTEAAGERVHLLHCPSPRPDALPLLLTHGWPGSVVEFLDVIDLLTDDYHVVVLSMPGYGFSGPTTRPGVDVNRVADAAADVMSQLGYDRFVAQGGDWGALVTRRLGEAHADRLIGLHVNMLFAMPGADEPDPMGGVTEAEQARLATAAQRIQGGIGYMAIQSTRPHTLGFGLEDSPVGLAAWILEKFHAWCDLREGMPISVDRLLDNVMLYWLTGTATSAARLYQESAAAGTSATDPWSGQVTVPTGHAVYPYELLQTPRVWADRRYRIAHWSEQPRGGHFAAFEQPTLFADDLRTFGRVLRDAD